MQVKKQQLEQEMEQWIGSKLGKEYLGIPDHLTCLSYAGQETTVRTRHGTMHRFKIGKAVYCHPAYLTSMQSTSSEILGWMNHRLGTGLLGEVTTPDTQIPL